jgi:hypothetical protein
VQDEACDTFFSVPDKLNAENSVANFLLPHFGQINPFSSDLLSIKTSNTFLHPVHLYSLIGIG